MLTDEQQEVLAVLGISSSASRPGCCVWRLPTDPVHDPELVVKQLEVWLVVQPTGSVRQSLECCWCGGRDLYSLVGELTRPCTTCEVRAPHRHVSPDGRVRGS